MDLARGAKMFLVRSNGEPFTLTRYTAQLLIPHILHCDSGAPTIERPTIAHIVPRTRTVHAYR
jgi:hypothetical protein